MNETWKEIPGYNGAYRISNCGRVQCCLSPGDNKITSIWWEKKARKNKAGYMLVNLTKNSKTTTKYVHALVMDAFVGKPDEKQEIDHIDGNRANNNINNLRYVSHIENLANPTTLARRLNSQRSSCVAQVSKDGIILCIYPSIHRAELETGISRKQISSVAKGKNHYNTEGGYKWQFVQTT